MKTDLTKLYKSYYTARKNPEIAIFEPAQFIAIDGKGDPSGSKFSNDITALYAVAYTIKFTCKALNNDFIVPKLEGLWWYDENKFGTLSFSETPSKVNRSEWEYRLMIRIPDFVTPEIINHAILETATKKQIANIKTVYLYKLHEGKCVQALHTGPFDTEVETLQRIQKLILDKGFARNGLHHEIYLSDFRKTSPDKLRTILREPVK